MVHECEYLLEHELDDRSHPALCGVGGLELLSKLKEIKDSKRGAAEMDPTGLPQHRHAFVVRMVPSLASVYPVVLA
jgi:hypothetical protein